ncbi:MAG: prephenate dehydratase [bacterium]|nr:prephenate dehydratase [bacterium]
MDLQEIRKQLDGIDAQIVKLTEERMQLSAEVAAFKIETGKPVYDREREKQKLQAVGELAHGAFNRQAMQELFTQIMTISRRYQYQILAEHNQEVDMGFQEVAKLAKTNVRVVYQGVEGAYSQAAAIQCFGEDTPMYHVKTWEDAMREVEEERADYAVLPIENSSAGAVTDNYDLLVKYHNYIVAEICIPIRHALLGTMQAELADVRTVFSHPQALMQSSVFLNAHRDWKQISVENTAVAAKKVLEDGDVTQAAVASEIAGKLYGLKVLESAIQYNKSNTTRFIVVAKSPIYEREANKVSVCFELPHVSGSLYNMLGNFIFNRVNMMKIESRPIAGKNWEYRFFVDIEGNLGQAGVRNALKGIFSEAANVKILGCYKSENRAETEEKEMQERKNKG